MEVAVSGTRSNSFIRSFIYLLRVYKTNNNSEQTVGRDSKATRDALITALIIAWVIGSLLCATGVKISYCYTWQLSWWGASLWKWLYRTLTHRNWTLL